MSKRRGAGAFAVVPPPPAEEPKRVLHAILAQAADGTAAVMAFSEKREDADRIVFAVHLLEMLEAHDMALQNIIEKWSRSSWNPASREQCNELLDNIRDYAALTRPHLEKK